MGDTIGNSLRLDKCSEKSTSRNNTVANLSRPKKGVTSTANLLGNFRVKKVNSTQSNLKDTKDSLKNSCINEKKSKRSVNQQIHYSKDNLHSWKRIKKMGSMKDNNELNMTK